MVSVIEGPFTLNKFQNASVTQIQSSSGWSDQISQIRIDLVEDDGDFFLVPEPGVPYSFTFEGFRFDGIAQNHGESHSSAGSPLYNITLYSPVEILEAVQLILDSYRGVNLIIPNLLNVFGYLEGEDLSDFGGSGKNESGIAWWKIRYAIEQIQQGNTSFSPGIFYKGHQYIVDFGAVPPIPDFYRMGGSSFMSLSQAIRTIFEDSGYDYLVCLEKGDGFGPHRIYFKTKSRLFQSPTGAIQSFIDSKQGSIISYNKGAELRNDITTGVILGGNVEEAVAMEDSGNGATIWPFWGFQQSTILFPFGTEGNEPIVESTGFDNEHTVQLNAISIANLINTPDGSPPLYECNILEMRFALHSFESWCFFISYRKPELAEYFGLEVFPGVFGKDTFQEDPRAFYASKEEAVGLLTNDFVEDSPREKLEALYDFVRGQADTYLGKQFIVRIPFFLKYYFEEETNQINYNLEVNSDGYWADYLGVWGFGPLSLYYQNFNHFTSPNGKFTPYVRFSGPMINRANINSRSATDTILQDNGIFGRCSIDSRIIYTPTPAALITLDEPLWSVPTDPYGGINEIAQVMGVSRSEAIRLAEINGNDFPCLYPMPFAPTGAVLTLKSNEYTYGPWHKIGVAGKVKIEQDAGLVPWNYGGTDIMVQAAEAQLADIGAVAQMEESGDISVAGAPDISLGDPLVATGPVVTSIDVSVGSTGVTTTYRMRSHTAVYGAFSRQNAERLRRLGTAAQELRRTMRTFFDRMRESNRTSTQIAWQYRNSAARRLKETPQMNVFQVFMAEDPTTGYMVPHITSKSFLGSLAGSQAHDPDKFQRVASVGLEGLLMPFSTNPYDEHFPVFRSVDSSMDPFAGIKWMANGATYNGFYTPRSRNDDFIRSVGLRGPITLVGHGKDLFGKPVPNANEDVVDEEGEVEEILAQDLSDDYLDEYEKRINKWKAGGIPLRWDKFNKVWTIPTVLKGEFQGDAKMKVKGYDDVIDIEHFVGGEDLEQGTNIICVYDPIDDVWEIVAAKCDS